MNTTADKLMPISPKRAPRFSGAWGRVAVFLIVGYLAMGRSFAYLGLPWFSLYIGEMALAAFVLFGPKTSRGRWITVARRAPNLKLVKLFLLLSLGFGAFEALRGILSGYPAFTAVRDTAFNYYPLFLFWGIWVGLKERDFLQRVVRALAWWNGVYGLTYVLLLGRLPWMMPGTTNAASDVPLFGQPGGSAIALLGLIALEPELRRVYHLLALNLLVLVGLQIRAEWVGFTVGLLLLGWYTKQMKRIVFAGASMAVLFGIMYVSKIDLPSPDSRGGRISVESIVARAAAPVNKDFASDLVSDEDVGHFAGDATWRLVWWAAIWSKVHGSASSALFGLGYGYPLGDLNPFIEPGTFIQTPHNDFFYLLAFSGWVGVALFAWFQVELLRLLVRTCGINGQPFGLVSWAAFLAGSMFEPFFEGPMGAIPFYLLIGIALAPGITASRASAALRSNTSLGRKLHPADSASVVGAQDPNREPRKSDEGTAST